MSVIMQSCGGVPGLSMAAVKSTPRTVALAVRLMWRSSRGTLTGAMMLHAVSGAGIAVQLLVGRELLQVVLHTNLRSGAVRGVAPWLVALVFVTFLVNLAAT